MAKYLQIGQKLSGSKGEYIQIDNLNLKKFLSFIKDHGEKHLKGLTEDEIKEGQKIKYTDEGHIPRVMVFVFDPNDGAPDFIKGNLAIKVE